MAHRARKRVMMTDIARKLGNYQQAVSAALSETSSTAGVSEATGERIRRVALGGLVAPAVLGCALAARAPALAEEADGKVFTVAVAHGTYAGGRHQDEFDGALRRLGWPARKYPSTKEGLERLAADLPGCDMVLFCPLFNYDPAEDVSVHAGRFADFVRGGGALVITDANYPQAFSWLRAVSPSLEANTKSPCQAKSPPSDVDPPHPLRFLPNRLHEDNMWAHLVLPADHQWEVVLRCGEGSPITMVKRLGRGFVYMTSLRQPNVATLENLRANLELQRLGLAVTRFGMPSVTVGRGEASIGLRCAGESAASAKVVLDVRALPRFEPSDEAGEWLLQPNEDSAETFSADVSLAPGEGATVAVPYHVSLRGPATASLRVAGGAKAATLFERRIVLPELLALRPPMYRGLVSTARRSGSVSVGVDIAPDEEDVAKLAVELELKDPAGKRLFRAKVDARTGLDRTKPDVETTLDFANERFRVPVPLDRGAAPGEYIVAARLLDGTKPLAEARTTITVLEPAPNQVVIDDDMSLIVEGKPFFPVGIYHVGRQDLPKVAELGLNTVQVWSWDGVPAVDDAGRLGLKVIFEINHNSPGAIREWAPKLKGHPALLAWYGRDEPYEADFDSAKALSDAYHQCDLDHPTYMVSCTPRLFPQHALLADIMAVDPYPYPRSPLTEIARHADLAWEATRGEKPVWQVPQSFGGEPEREARCMAYLAVVHEAKGILWYPWDDGQKDGRGVGLKYYEAGHAAVRRIATEIRALAPALLDPDGRARVRGDDERVHALACRDPGGRRYLIAVNPTPEAASADLAVEGLRGVRSVKEAFGPGSLRPRAGRLEFGLGAFEVKVLAW